MGMMTKIMDKLGLNPKKVSKDVTVEPKKEPVKKRDMKRITKKPKKKKKIAIPEHVQGQIILRVDKFNRKKMSKRHEKYYAEIKGKFIYLMFAMGGGQLDPICRLKYTGDLENMDFAIYRYSSEKYDPNELFFPGGEFVDGTLEGAMKAGIRAYL